MDQQHNIVRKFRIHEISAVDRTAQESAVAQLLKSGDAESHMDAMEVVYAKEHGISVFEAATALARDPTYNALFEKALAEGQLNKRRKLDGLNLKDTPARHTSADPDSEDESEEDEGFSVGRKTDEDRKGIRRRQKRLAEDLLQKRVELMRREHEPEYETHTRLAQSDPLYQQAYAIAYEYSY